VRLRVILADDHLPTRAGVRGALEAHGMDVCAEVGTGEQAVEAAIRLKPDVCLLDTHMPGAGGIAAAARIAEAVPESAVVMLAAEASDDDLFAALSAGARGYLLKDTDPDRLGHAVEGVLSGEAALPRTLVMRVIEEFRSRDGRRRIPLLRPGGEALTEREWEVLGLMAEGDSTHLISQRLKISDVTVRRHVSAILRKLQVGDRAAAIALLRSATSPRRSGG
jgi:two-component system nitrate/nitrite response regulator NarL